MREPAVLLVLLAAGRHLTFPILRDIVVGVVRVAAQDQACGPCERSTDLPGLAAPDGVKVVDEFLAMSIDRIKLVQKRRVSIAETLSFLDRHRDPHDQLFLVEGVERDVRIEIPDDRAQRLDEALGVILRDEQAVQCVCQFRLRLLRSTASCSR